MRVLFLVMALALASCGANGSSTPPSGRAGAETAKAETILLRIGKHRLQVEVADEDPERIRGLMFRERMDEDAGMLFVFPDQAPRSFWMRNTYIPLSIAYIDSEKRIVSIHDMMPRDETSVPSAGPARYALEVNQGWFDAHGVRAGDLVEFTLPFTP